MIPSDVLAEAEARAYPYLTETALARGPLLRQIGRLENEVVQMAGVTSPSTIDSAGTPLTVTLNSNRVGYQLDFGSQYHAFTWVDSDGVPYSPEIRMVPENQFDYPPVNPAGILRGTVFFPCDPLKMRWTGNDQREFFRGDGDTITYRKINKPPAVTTLTQTLQSPDIALTYFSATLALSIVSVHQAITGLVPPPRLQEMRAIVLYERQLLVNALSRTVQRQSSAGHGVE